MPREKGNLMGPEGLEPSHLAIQEPKSCVSASFTTGPNYEKV